MSIEEMLASGMSIDEVMKKAQEIKAEMDKKNEPSELDIARLDMINAIAAYGRLVIPKEIRKEMFDEEDLDDIIEAVIEGLKEAEEEIPLYAKLAVLSNNRGKKDKISIDNIFNKKPVIKMETPKTEEEKAPVKPTKKPSVTLDEFIKGMGW